MNLRNDMLAYIDSNVFIFAAISYEGIGMDSRRLLDAIVRGRVRAITSTLTFDEVFYKVKKDKGMDFALLLSENLISMPNLEFVSVGAGTITDALGLIRAFNLEPRDAIHAAVAVSGKADLLVSEDRVYSRLERPKIATVNKALLEIKDVENR